MLKVRAAAMRNQLPEDAIQFAEARQRQAELEERFRNHVPTNPSLREDILRLYETDQSVRQKDRFDARKMKQTDRKLEARLKLIFSQRGVPTYDMVGVDAAKAFLVMVQHQSPAFRQAVLPKLKANVNASQGDGGILAMVYDRTQRDQGMKQLCGEQLECSPGKALSEAPVEDEPHVDDRRSRLA